MLAYTSLPKLLAVRHQRPSLRIGRTGRLPRVRIQSAATGPLGINGGGGSSGGSGGSGGGDDDEFYSDDPDFNPRDFSLFAVLTLIQDKPKKLAFYEIAEIEVDEEEEEEEEVYVKPAPKPKALSMSYSRSASLLLLLLLLSGGIFLWRRSKNQHPPSEEDDETVLVQRTRELQVEPAPREPEAEASGDNSAAARELREESPGPDFVKELDEQDALFGTDRDVKIETSTPNTPRIEAPEIPEATAAQTREPEGDKSVVEEGTSVPPVQPQGFKSPEEKSAEGYYADLEFKDALFQDERVSDKKDPATGEQLVAVQFTSSKDDPEALIVDYSYPNASSRDLENEMSDR